MCVLWKHMLFCDFVTIVVRARSLGSVPRMKLDDIDYKKSEVIEIQP